jgi:hypothetical protein
MLVFGGADRNMCHFNDLHVCRVSAAGIIEWECVEATGDVPPVRSGHAVAMYGKFMLLYGGIDFTEEAVYNDLYSLCTESFEWKYVGEAGAEIPARNSHSLEVMTVDSMSVLVLFGGASPSLGPLKDTYYALLPPAAEIDQTQFYVRWNELQASDSGGRCPSAREMHSSCVIGDGKMIVTGGRGEDGIPLDEVWCLSAGCVAPVAGAEGGLSGSSKPESEPQSDASNATSTDTTFKNISLEWSRLVDLALPSGMCAHGCVATGVGKSTVCVFGGFTSTGGITNNLMSCSLRNYAFPVGAVAKSAKEERREPRWSTVFAGSGGVYRAYTPANTSSSGADGQMCSQGKRKDSTATTPSETTSADRSGLDSLTVEGSRFDKGHSSALPAATAICERFAIGTCEAPGFLLTAMHGDGGGGGDGGSGGVVVFGGVSIENDHSDTWLITL